MKSTQSMCNACSKHFTWIRLFWIFIPNLPLIFEIYNPINVKCLLQAFHIDWEVSIHWLGSFEIQPKQAIHIDWEVSIHWLGSFEIGKIFLNFGEYIPINVKCLLQAFHIDWAVLKLWRYYWSLVNISQSMWNACCKHFTLIG